MCVHFRVRVLEFIFIDEYTELQEYVFLKIDIDFRAQYVNFGYFIAGVYDSRGLCSFIFLFFFLCLALTYFPFYCAAARESFLTGRPWYTIITVRYIFQYTVNYVCNVIFFSNFQTLRCSKCTNYIRVTICSEVQNMIRIL